MALRRAAVMLSWRSDSNGIFQLSHVLSTSWSSTGCPYTKSSTSLAVLQPMTHPKQPSEAAPPATPPAPPASTAPPLDPALSAAQVAARHVLYKGKWIFPFRLLVRGKVFQLFGVAGVTGATAVIILGKDVSNLEAAGLAFLGLGTAAASLCLWYYSRRYVGELSLLEPDRTVARFSTLDFWGNREDTDVEVRRIQPPFKGLSPIALRKLVASPLFPVNVEGDRQYFMSARQAVISDKETLTRLMDGRYMDDLKNADKGQAVPPPRTNLNQEQSAG